MILPAIDPFPAAALLGDADLLTTIEGARATLDLLLTSRREVAAITRDLPIPEGFDPFYDEIHPIPLYPTAGRFDALPSCEDGTQERVVARIWQGLAVAPHAESWAGYESFLAAFGAAAVAAAGLRKIGAKGALANAGAFFRDGTRRMGASVVRPPWLTAEVVRINRAILRARTPAAYDRTGWDETALLSEEGAWVVPLFPAFLAPEDAARWVEVEVARCAAYIVHDDGTTTAAVAAECPVA